ncbi:MAG: HAMP domain-containing histidine kinase, partial [Nitrospinota bacterium]|nr:HAMP domain-containing histidine kinase [Nitrospinota bacterium]
MKKNFLDLRFPPELEERFQEEQFKNSIFIYRVLALLGAALYGLFFLSDYRDFPDTIEQAFIIRFMVVIPILLALAGLTFTSVARRWIRPFACFGLLSAEGGALALLAIINSPQAQLIYFGSTMLMLSVTNAIIWQGFAWTAFTAAAMIISYAVVVSAMVKPFVPLVKHIELLCAMAAFGATANYFVELRWRNEFKIDAELRRQKRRAENATRLKDKFVSLVSHDLRAPLSSVLGLVEFLKSPDGAEMGAKRREEILANIQATLEDLLRLINQLLKLSTLRTGKISVQKKIIVIRALVDQQISNIAHLAEKKGVHISNETPEDMTVVADPALLGEVIHNLLANAVKFTHEGDSITVFQKQGAGAEIAVKDSGAGIMQENLPNIFKHDSRVTSSTVGERGTGLGLPYSHDIISAHGGSLRVESAPGKGSV